MTYLADIGGAGYAGYSVGSYALGGSSSAAATKRVVASEGSARLLAEFSAGALEVAEMISPLAILI